MHHRAVLAWVVAFGLALSVGVAVPAVAAAGPAAASPADPVIAPFSAGVTRLSGQTRYDTAIAVSQRYSPGVEAAFVATGADFPDALSAASAAAELGGPLLLTQPNQLPAAVGAELTRLQPQHIYVVGGTGVISAGVATALSHIASTERLAGADRYATADAIIRTAFAHTDHAIIATGRSFPDALAATGAAGARHAPIVLVDGSRSTVTGAVLSRLSAIGATTISIVGGPSVVSSGIQAQLSKAGMTVTRYAGKDRYATAALLNAAYFPAGSSPTSFLATGLDFADALSAGALAGRLAAPLELSARTCVDPAVGDQLSTLAATSNIVLGGESVVSSAAALNTHCVYPIVTEPLTGWATSGWALSTTADLPYSDRPPVDVNSSSVKVDSTGLVIYTRRDNGARADHPVAYAQYGISALLEYQKTGNTLWLNRAIRQGQQLIAIHTVSNGSWWFPYSFPWTYYDRTLKAPWYSGMAQGEVLSLFVRLAEATHDSVWDNAANKTVTSFTQQHSASAPWVSLAIDHHLYFEEYAGNQPPLLVLNGHIFALFGLYDYWRHTGNATVAGLIDGAATTVLERMLPAVRVVGGVSYYCVQAVYCQSPLWQNANYHPIHSWQLDTLARLTGDTRFSTWAQLLRSDWAPIAPFSLAPRSVPLAPQPQPRDQAPDLGTW
ncbi:cell wall-binding repeat-containing protein [Diaminobutyricibacter sp. McL0608]|uniref:cell wall-binding repeat-containing protein n=1 Tax=Leifsonia sp. McL0608 TaxID=3143537 RepID=UPI0031F2DD61